MNQVWSVECTSFWEGRGGSHTSNRLSGSPKTYPNVFGLDFGIFALLHTWDAHEGGCFCYFEDGRPASRSLSGEYAEYLRTLGNCLGPYRRNVRPNEILVLQLLRTREAVEHVRTVFRDWSRVPYNQLYDTFESIVPRRLLPKYMRLRVL